ncbi:MAG TPA: 2-amino-4-hydroxy-6-hydroxymethyldihydropteridine diphosphokinase [Chitinophagaceae bacterium]|nr:2-amino-4-hydroxy-6-hydroxymethyldihydropteridine diphosphokinase [Chitinophagaceae bacterium]
MLHLFQNRFMNTAYLLIGSNQGDRESYLRKAVELVSRQIGKIEQISSVYETAAWGKIEQPDYLNQAVRVNTYLKTGELLKAILAIEVNMGRIRRKIWEPRIIDIDILFYNKDIINEEHLHIPHAHLQERRFVLVPLAEIDPEFIHPILNLPISELLEACQDTLQVKKYSPVPVRYL